MPNETSPTSQLSRRSFLKSTAAVTAASGLLPAVASLAEATAPAPSVWPENGTLIPDDGWHLWVDQHAEWKNDTLYLPEDVRPGGPGDIAKLPVNPPTGGWSVLSPAHPDTLPVTLPSTVEQHLWGKFGQRPYTPDEYRYAADDPIPQNGAYLGVSWWYRPIDIPKEMQGKRIFLHIRGAHLRAEVYLNGKLVGYSIMEELPFEADLTHAANPGGENLLAIRITNPFGRYDWVDGSNAQWGAVKLYRSHGFGGLDRGMTIRAVHPAVHIQDAWILNGPEAPRTSEDQYVLHMSPGPNQAHILVQRSDSSITSRSIFSSIELEIVDPADGTIISKPRITQVHESDRGLLVTAQFGQYNAKLWDLDSPKLYHMRITLKHPETKLIADTRTIPFGFRTFAPVGLGKDAFFRLNGKRIKIYSSISWGFWGINGMWPTPELAEKEVTQAKKLGLNCLNFHRNLAKEDVLRAHDRLGLLRYMEPGAGKLAIGKLPAGAATNAAGTIMEKPTAPADKFAQRYMFVKCVEMVKAFRSHPSVIEYCLQNEIGADLKNPDTLAVLAAMRLEDPSRCIVLNDGFVAPPRKAAQAWYEPWNDKLHRSDEEEWGGWWNQHQGAGDQWYDEFYKSPTEFTYISPHKSVITEFGEMEGCATPDNHSLMLHQHADPVGTGIGRQPANKSYDHVDHAEILAATDKWLDKWKFREAFPATEQLWLSIGRKCYDTWQNYMENARISNDLDFAVISGWESTSIENHSGIVDNLRNFKSDPTPIAATLQPVRPVAKQRSICTALGQPAVFDLFLFNDTSQPAGGTLSFTAVTPSGKLLKLAEFPAPAQTPDVSSYLIQEAFATPALTEEGMYRFRFSISSSPQATQTKEIWVAGVPQYKRTRMIEVAISGIAPPLRRQLAELEPRLGIHVQDFKPGGKYDLIVSSGLTAKTSAKQESGDTTGLEAQPGAAKVVPGRKLEPGEGPEVAQTGKLADGILEAVKAGTPLLAIPQADALSEGVARQLAAAGAFTYAGTVGDFRAPWMGNWYFVRKHPLYDGLPQDQAMGIHYAAKGRQSNGLLVDGPNVEIVAGYSRDHDRNIGAGTFTTRLGATKVLYHRVPEMQPVLQLRFLANAIRWLMA
ncbi:sugar-binding domain-containing protein [Granulicella rosea]|nr:sugar-binding domain-containing protein [Granulicella rosea]